MSAIEPRLDVSPNPEALAHRVAQWIVDLACHNSARFAVCLSGGSTPRRLYQLLAAPPLRDVMPWHRVHWFWGDERFVPWDHPDSNYGMAREAMLAHVPVPPGNIHGVEFAGTPADAARAYQDVLQSHYGTERLDPARPLFDVVLLGMGPDGHTASLIPGEPVLDEKARWVAEVTHGRPEARITLTFPALDSSRSTAFVAAGADKRTMMQRVLAGDRELPAARIRPIGELIWFIDNAAQGSQ
jgi:6-phosphogluconolactonase